MPHSLGALTAHGTPRNALIASTVGIALAAGLSALAPHSAFLSMVAISSFGALFTWLMIFVTHYCFRRAQRGSPRAPAFRLWGFPATTLAGASGMLALLLTTPFTAAFRMTLLFGVPFLGVLVVIYWLAPATRRVAPVELRGRARGGDP
jgi:L-asparagine transporter-like permease